MFFRFSFVPFVVTALHRSIAPSAAAGPAARDALEIVLAPRHELDPRADHEVPDGPGDPDRRRGGRAQDARSDVDRDAGDVVGGKVDLDYAPEGVRCVIDVPVAMVSSFA